MRFNKLIPELSVSNLKKSIFFYTKILGFNIEYQRPENKFAFLSLQGSQLMIQEINDAWKVGKLGKPFGRGINFQIEVKEIKPILASLKKYNITLFEKPKENWYRQGRKLLGEREFLVQDPDGYLLRFSEEIGTKPLI